MACPYFCPGEARAADARAAMLPLGDLWVGTCHARAEESCQPEETAVRPLCNLGYARGQCKRFSVEDPGPDAVRFTIRREEGRSLHLYYVLERDHHPFGHGALEYSMEARRFTNAPDSALLTRQAEAYVASYLRRKA
jgi:hypothetical protein